MSTIKQKLFTNWHLMRVLRLGISVWAIAMAIQSHDWAIGILGVFFLYQAITDTGCCGSACYTPPRRTRMPGRSSGEEPIEFEEVK